MVLKVRGVDVAVFKFSIRNAGSAPGSAVVVWGLGDREYVYTGYSSEWIWKPSIQSMEAVTLNPGESRNFRLELPISDGVPLRSYAARVALLQVAGDVIAEAVVDGAVDIIARVAEPLPVTPVAIPIDPGLASTGDFVAPVGPAKPELIAPTAYEPAYVAPAPTPEPAPAPVQVIAPPPSYIYPGGYVPPTTDAWSAPPAPTPTDPPPPPPPPPATTITQPISVYLANELARLSEL